MSPDLVGIATRHVDALGVWHEPDDETLSRLIAAFGLPADPQQAADALAEEERAAPFGLAPVHIVAQETPPPALPLAPAGRGANGAEWHCRLEDGGEHAPAGATAPSCVCRPDCRSAITG